MVCELVPDWLFFSWLAFIVAGAFYIGFIADVD